MCEGTGNTCPLGSSYYYASYGLLASFVLVNVLLGVVISSLGEAREREREQDEHAGAPHAPEQELRERIAAARRALDELEESLARFPTSRRPHSRR